MNAPPRRILAPDSLTAVATSMICSSDSTEQGPAIMAKYPPPMRTSPTSIMVSLGWNFRLACLKGSETRLTVSTISRLLRSSISTLLVSPIRPRMVISLPWDTWTSRFIRFSQSIRCWVCSGVVPLFNTAIIVFFSLHKKRCTERRSRCSVSKYLLIAPIFCSTNRYYFLRVKK